MWKGLNLTPETAGGDTMVAYVAIQGIAEPDLTFTKALDLARVLESVDRDVQDLQSQHQKTTVNFTQKRSQTHHPSCASGPCLITNKSLRDNLKIVRAKVALGPVCVY